MARNANQPQYESKIQASILQYLRSLPGCWPIKVMTANENGCPDILCCYRGKFVAFEVKTAQGKATSLQVAQIKAINFAGGTARVVRSKDDVKYILKEME